MQKLFNKILVPIDFTDRTTAAVEKASEIATKYNCTIHLLHVVVIVPHTGIPQKGQPMDEVAYKKSALDFELGKLCESIRVKCKNATGIQHSILSGTWNESIIHFANLHQFDVILIGQKVITGGRRSMRFNPDIIAAKTNVAVFTVPANRSFTKLCSILIPVTDFLPVRKLMYGVYMASDYNATIRLLGIENTSTKPKVMYYMMKAYKLIRDNCSVEVTFEKTYGANVAEAVNKYALANSADLIILNPGTQTKMPGMLSSLLSNIIQKYSSPPVLTINPA